MSLHFSNDYDINVQLERTIKKNAATRLRLVVFFTFFLLLILTLVKNDYSLAFDKEKTLELSCGPKNSQDLINDDMEGKKEKAEKAILANQELLSTLNGFEKIYSAEEPRGYQKRSVVIIKLIFSQEDPLHKKIPDQICGFDVDLIYK